MHPNIVPLLGVTADPLLFVSDWMPEGNLVQYIERNQSVDRLGLVGDFPPVSDHTLTPSSYPISLKVLTTSTPVTCFTGASKRYVIVRTLVVQVF